MFQGTFLVRTGKLKMGPLIKNNQNLEIDFSKTYLERKNSQITNNGFHCLVLVVAAVLFEDGGDLMTNHCQRIQFEFESCVIA
jgi:hypothetical protein